MPRISIDISVFLPVLEDIYPLCGFSPKSPFYCQLLVYIRLHDRWSRFVGVVDHEAAPNM
jgi:hypothetical protein